MTDPKSRKVIVLENPLLPTRIKEMLARCLFEDLQVSFFASFVLLSSIPSFPRSSRHLASFSFQVPSISFIPPHLLALLAIGRTTGLVVDVGYLETVVLPVSRRLLPLCFRSFELTISFLSSLVRPTRRSTFPALSTPTSSPLLSPPVTSTQLSISSSFTSLATTLQSPPSQQQLRPLPLPSVQENA